MSLIIKNKLKSASSFGPEDSPLPKPKPDTFKRSKINFTMKDLENSDNEEDDICFEIPQVDKRLQPKRICQPKLDVPSEESKDSEDSSSTFIDNSLDLSNSKTCLDYQDYQI